MKAGMTEEELDAAVDVIAAVDAGVLQSLSANQAEKQDITAEATRITGGLQSRSANAFRNGRKRR